MSHVPSHHTKGLGLGQTQLYIFIKPTSWEVKQGYGWLTHCSVCHTTSCMSSYGSVRVGRDLVIYFHKTYNLLGESKVRVGSSIVLYVTQHFACHHMQGLGLAQTQLYIFIKSTICERKIS